MTTVQSRKAKGRRLQKLVVSKLLAKFNSLSERDLQSRSMGAQGTDVVMSEKAFSKFGYNIECKNKEINKSLLNDFCQAQSNSEHGKPLLILSANNSPVLAVIKFDDLLELFNDE